MSNDPQSRKNPRSPQERAKAGSDRESRRILRQISRSRTRLLVCFLTLPVYVVAVWILLDNRQSIDSFMFIYMGVWAAFGIDMARRRCPRCGEQFFVRVIWLNLLTKKCAHCSLPLDRHDDKEDEQRIDF